MIYFNNILCVEAGWLVDKGVMTSDNYRQMNSRRDIHVVRRGCRNTPALVDYESLPERFKRKVDEVLRAERGCTAYEAARVNEIEVLIENSTEIAHYFDAYLTASGKHLPQEKRREYYANAVVIEAAMRWQQAIAGKRKVLGMRPRNLWAQTAELVQEIDRVRYPHQLPANARSLERKIQQYRAEGPASLVHKNYQAEQCNAAKVADNEQESILATLISDPRNLDNAQVAHFYNMLAENMEWKKISASAVAVWRDKLQETIYTRRHGSAAQANNRDMQIRRRRPEYPLTYWTLDGWDAELLYQDDENGTTTYHKRPTVVVVLDTCCDYPIGFAIGTHENSQLIMAALRNAMMHTTELFGKMYRTSQIQSDNYAISMLKPVYEQLADYATPAKVGNAKSKVIEPWFKRFNKRYCQLQPNWSGFGVTSKKENQPNVEFLRKYKKQFPGYTECVEQLASLIEMERARLRDKMMEMYSKMPAERLIEMQRENYLLLFGESNGRKSLLQGSGLKVTIGGETLTYDCFDARFREYSSTRWTVLYDPDDTTTALAVNDDKTLQFLLEEKYTQPMALVDRSEGDYEQLERVRQYNEANRERRMQRMCEYQDRAETLLENNNIAELETLQKLLLTDSKGQHKNRRNQARLAMPVTVEAEATKVADKDDLTDLYDIY